MFKSITTKLFTLSAITIAIFLGAMLLLQSYFFENYYIDKKMQTNRQYAAELAKAYSETVDRFGSEIGGLVTRYSQNYGLVVFYLENTSDPGTNAGGSGSTLSTTITTIEKDETSSSIPSDPSFYRNVLHTGQELYMKNKAEMDAGKRLSYSENDIYGNTSVITVNSILSRGETVGMLFVMSSLQPVGEAVGVIRDYYGMFFLGALLIILALSFFFSRQVSKPLLHLNKVATSIAGLDFTQECTLKSNDELGHLSRTINRLSSNLSNAICELRQANKELACEINKQKEAEEMRKLFVAGISHELKTPISIIQGYTEGIIDGMEKGMIKKDYAAVILNETERMSRTISDMLDLTQLEAGKYRLNIKTLTIGRMIRYVLGKFTQMIDEGGIKVSVDIPDKQIIALGDSLRIEQVLSNLIHNAVRYTPPGGNIRIKVTQEVSRVRFEIENNCPEITSEELRRIWEDFYRIEPSRNRDLGGTGLGLSVVKSILELHKSEYGAQKTESGIVFYFMLEKSSDDKFTEEAEEFFGSL